MTTASLRGTLIIGDLDERKMTGGASGTLPVDIHGLSRGALIESYHQHFGKRYVPVTVDAALNWSQSEDHELTPPALPTPWSMLAADCKKKRARGKDKQDMRHDPLPSKRRRTTKEEVWKTKSDITSPPTIVNSQLPTSLTTDPQVYGLVWDNRDWSCAYDSLLMILFNGYRDYGEQAMRTWAPGNEIFNEMRLCFNVLALNVGLLETVRNRAVLRSTFLTPPPCMALEIAPDNLLNVDVCIELVLASLSMPTPGPSGTVTVPYTAVDVFAKLLNV
ncbi:hypothetical protein A0H81_05660 [Grifola frondosa]|uniref:Uncharacterized protein n=1 Tax=Grifola frondosa TaxID=5627 RepID=A0A1C7MDR4_GRIFR|nr:hypothetical protein A0H81_05660 [Grifola frondosa]